MVNPATPDTQIPKSNAGIIWQRSKRGHNPLRSVNSPGARHTLLEGSVQACRLRRLTANCSERCRYRFLLRARIRAPVNAEMTVRTIVTTAHVGMVI